MFGLDRVPGIQCKCESLAQNQQWIPIKNTIRPLYSPY